MGGVARFKKLLLFLFSFSLVQAAVTTYEVAPADTFPVGCNITSGSVTIVNCPEEKKYTVYLSELLYNMTISEVENTINEYDDALEVRYDPEDYIRVIEVTDVNVTSVKLSKEKRFA
jgi:hypothetical protein